MQFLTTVTAVFALRASCAINLVPRNAPSEPPARKALHSFGYEHIGNVEPMYTYSLNPPFLHTNYDNEWWEFGGDVLIKVYDYIRLAAERSSQKGYIWSKSPLKVDPFVIEIDFRIHGHSPSLFGDGFGFFLVTEKYQSGPVFGFKDNFKGLAVFFDTFANGQHDHSFPYISAMLGDGNTSYDHNNDNKATVAGHGCEANIRGSNNAIRAKITYYQNKVLELQFTDNNDQGWQTCFVLSNVTLPQEAYMGFSSATGDLFDNHDILRVMTYRRLDKDDYKGNDATNSFVHDDVNTGHGHHSWAGFFYTWFLRLGGVSIVAAVGLFIYRAVKNDMKSTKRF